MEKLRWMMWGGLSTTHLIWAVALFAEPFRLGQRMGSPLPFGIIHLATPVLILSNSRVAGLTLSTAILSYYWAFVKPLEPVAEPQSVGILFISASELVRNLSTDNLITHLLLRGGLAYPLLEWGLDALRNPFHFAEYMASNPVTSQALPYIPLYPSITALGIYEIMLGIWMVSGMRCRPASIVLVSTLILFSGVAGYPLALPQNIALITAALYHGFGPSPSS
ncbi:MAG: hypothetical protein QXK39_05595 [Nitrososphaerota archaeon]